MLSDLQIIEQFHTALKRMFGWRTVRSTIAGRARPDHSVRGLGGSCSVGPFAFCRMFMKGSVK